MDRRHFLQSLSATALSISAGQLFAAPSPAAASGAPRMLLVFLRGGYDAASLLVPTASDFYYESRPNIAIARPRGDGGESAGDTALPLADGWGLHPALRASMFPLYQAGQATFIPFAGTNDLSRSHFETQDAIELGRDREAAGQRDRSGFMNRLAQQLQGRTPVMPIAFTDKLPLAMQGRVLVPNVAVGRVGKQLLNAHQEALIDGMYRGSALGTQVQQGFAVRQEVMDEMQKEQQLAQQQRQQQAQQMAQGGMDSGNAMAAEMRAANRNAIAPKGFEAQARRVARLMRDRYTLGFIDVGGWDTHVGQGNARGTLANHFEELGRGLAAFPQEMGPAWRDTVIVVVSEFGRTFRENGNRGTDHGHGSVIWVVGGSVRGGRIAGEQIAVRPDTLFQNRDFPVLNEYRAVLGGLFTRLYGLSGAQLQAVFPGASPRDIGLA